METPQYPPLSEYGAIGNLQTCCLVSNYGSIDWCCFPHVESPSLFAAILDADAGGRFQIRPVYPFQSAQTYVDHTNVLTTEFYTATGQASLTDWMSFGEDTSLPSVPGTIFRKVTCERGQMEFTVDFQPRFDYAREWPRVTRTGQGVLARGADDELYLSAPLAFELEDGGARATLSLSAGETAWFAVRYGERRPHDPEIFQRRLDATVRGWQRWVTEGGDIAPVIDEGRWAELVDRSELVLKLLIHRATGSIAAAPTTSLPEEIGGSRNWDYRYNWIRDAGMTVQALAKLGHLAEAREYFSWLLSHVYEDPAAIQPLYGLHGETDLTERTLDHLEGYRGSAPVRVGNAAKDQRQLDVYGELVLAIYETSRFGETITDADWHAVCEIIDYVCEVWDERDAGIWEVRTGPRHFVHSKVMCWTALDRGIRLAHAMGFDAPVQRWQQVRRDIREAILAEGYDDDLGFLQTFETTDAVDATALLIPILGFLPVDDPRVRTTVDTIRRRLTTEEGLVYRYDTDDGLPGGEGTFVLCSFWLVDVLALSGRLEEAEALFASILAHASPLGLLSEEIAAESGALLGNFPQAFSHIGLVNSVLYLDAARRNRQPGPAPLGVQPRPGDDTRPEARR